MAYVNKFLSESDRAFFESLNIKSKLTSCEELVPAPRKWLVDKVRMAKFFILEGRGNELDNIPLYMALYYRGHLAIIEAYEDSSGDLKTGYNFNWKINKMTSDVALSDDKEKIRELIIDALHVVGYSYQKATVHVNKIAAPVS